MENSGLTLSDQPTLTDANIRVRSGSLTLDGDLTNDGVVIVEDDLLRFTGSSTLTGNGEVQFDGLFGEPYVQLSGGHTVTFGVGQTVAFSGGNLNRGGTVFGTGAGGTTIVNDGTLRIEQDATATVPQADESSVGALSLQATAQEFALVNNGGVHVAQDGRLAFVSDSSTGNSTTIDNRAGTITLGSNAQIGLLQQESTPTVLRGGQVIGAGDGTSQIRVSDSGASLTLSDQPVLTDVTVNVEEFGRLAIDGDLTNKGTINVGGHLLRLVTDTSLLGAGEVHIDARSADPFLEMAGGMTLTVGQDQALLFSGGNLQDGGTLFGAGPGGIGVVNNGMIRVSENGFATVLQADETGLGQLGLESTAQDFSLVNNGGLEIGNGATFAFLSDVVPGMTTTIDNRSGVITLEQGAGLWLLQDGSVTTTLRGGQIIGPADGSAELRVFDGDAGAVRSLVLTDSPTVTNTSIRLERGGSLSVEGVFSNNNVVTFSAGQLDASGEWVGTGELVFQEDGDALPSRIDSASAGTARFGSGQQLRVNNGRTTLSGATLAGVSANDAGSVVIEANGELRVESSPATIEGLSIAVDGVLDARADLTTTVRLPVSAGGHLRIEGATISAPEVTIESGAALTLVGGVLDVDAAALDGSVSGNGVIDSPNASTAAVNVGESVIGTSDALPITVTGWIEGPGLLDNVVIEGTHSPGDGIAFTPAGSLTYGANSSLRIELNSRSTSTPGFDRLTSTGVVDLGGDLDLQLVDYVEGALSVVDTLVLVDAMSLTGGFTNVASGDRVFFDNGEASARIDYGPTSLYDPDQVVLSRFTRDPETVVWVGGNDNWNSAANWDLLFVPNNEGVFQFNAVIVSGNVDVDIPVTLSGLTLNNFNQNLVLNQTMTVENFTWTAGSLNGPNVLTTTGTSTFNTTQQVNTGAGLINQGTATWVDGGLSGMFLGQGFVNEGEFLIELVDDNPFLYVTNTASGVIRHTGTAIASLGPNSGFENDGLVEITGGGTVRVGRDRANGSDGTS